MPFNIISDILARRKVAVIPSPTTNVNVNVCNTHVSCAPVEGWLKLAFIQTRQPTHCAVRIGTTTKILQINCEKRPIDGRLGFRVKEDDLSLISRAEVSTIEVNISVCSDISRISASTSAQNMFYLPEIEQFSKINDCYSIPLKGKGNEIVGFIRMRLFYGTEVCDCIQH